MRRWIGVEQLKHLEPLIQQQTNLLREYRTTAAVAVFASSCWSGRRLSVHEHDVWIMHN